MNDLNDPAKREEARRIVAESEALDRELPVDASYVVEDREARRAVLEVFHDQRHSVLRVDQAKFLVLPITEYLQRLNRGEFAGRGTKLR